MLATFACSSRFFRSIPFQQFASRELLPNEPIYTKPKPCPPKVSKRKALLKKIARLQIKFAKDELEAERANSDGKSEDEGENANYTSLTRPVVPLSSVVPSENLVEYIEEKGLGMRRKAKESWQQKKKAQRVPLVTPVDDPIFGGKQILLKRTAVSANSFPAETLPEIAFAGRSNVGKSSVLNLLAGIYKPKAYTGDKPGVTRSINFYSLGRQLMLVDFPGHGFAYAKESVRESWSSLIEEYISKRTCLKRVCLLLDARHGFKELDRKFMELMDTHRVSYQILLTKTDLVPPLELARRCTLIHEELQQKKPNVLKSVVMFSSKTRAGISQLRRELGGLALQKPLEKEAFSRG